MAEEYSNIKMLIDGPVSEMILNRPEKSNALDLATIREINKCIAVLNEKPSVRIVVIRGEGQHFCAGADLSWMEKASELSLEENIAESKELASLFASIFTSPKLFVAKISGACFGGGVGLASACDFVVATENAEFSFSEVRLGLVPATISPYVIYRIGTQKAKRLMLTGELKRATQLEGSGLIDLLTCEKDIDIDTRHLIKTLLKGAHKAQESIKELINDLGISKNKKFDIEEKTSRLIAESRISEEGKEGIRAFLEKREPKWK